MKILYCAKCGYQIPVIRKALPKFATIIDVIEPHECLDPPAEITLKPVHNPRIDINKEENKFVQKLNELGGVGATASIGGLDTSHLRDRRFDQEPVKSIAPPSVLGLIKGMENSVPARELEESED